MGDSVVFKQDSPYYEHFYNDLKPMVHYIPFKRDLSDLEEKIKWAKSHDKEVRFIIRSLSVYHCFMINVLYYLIITNYFYVKYVLSTWMRTKRFNRLPNYFKGTHNHPSYLIYCRSLAEWLRRWEFLRLNGPEWDPSIIVNYCQFHNRLLFRCFAMKIGSLLITVH